jgi:hypothetical protein
MLLVAMEYDQQQMQGPPFAGSGKNVGAHVRRQRKRS